jgi:hypothetical protein
MATFAALFAPVVMVAMSVSPPVNGAAGENTAVPLAYVTAPATSTDPEVTVNVLAVIVVGSIASLKMAVTFALK